MSLNLDGARLGNFLDVWRLYAFDEQLELLALIVQLEPAARDDLLRHHSKRKVSRNEILLRDTLDNLLSGCGILEVGFLSGTLADGEKRCESRLATLLRLPEVQVYYEARYPIPLPKRLLSRIDRGDTAPHVPSHSTWFAGLLNLDANFRDSKLKQFLRIVDGFRVQEITFELLKTHVKKGEAILEAITTPREERTTMQEAVAGLERFLFFCIDLCKVLDSVVNEPVLRGATYDFYRYWFAVRGTALMDIVDSTLSTLTKEERIEENQDLPERDALKRLFLMAAPEYAEQQQGLEIELNELDTIRSGEEPRES